MADVCIGRYLLNRIACLAVESALVSAHREETSARNGRFYYLN
jgi:hypothetical protein